MKYRQIRTHLIIFSLTIVALMTAGTALAAPQTHTSTHLFTMYDLLGDFDGTMLGGKWGNGTDPSIICGNPHIAGYRSPSACCAPHRKG